MLAKFGLPFDKATPLVHFPTALKRPRNNAGPASIYTICDTRAKHGSPILLIHFKLAFSKPLFSPVAPCNRGTCVHVCHFIYLFIGSGIYSLSFFIFPLDARFDLR